MSGAPSTAIAWIGRAGILAWLLLATSAAMADQHDPRLAALFEHLKSAPSGEGAATLEGQIWGIWLQSGNAAVDEVMATGERQMNTGDLTGAADSYSRAIDLAPDFAEAWNKRATALYLLGRFDDSIADIGHVLALEPRHFGALSGLGLCDVQLKQERAALSAFERALAINPHLPAVESNVEALKQSLARHSI